MISNNSEGLCEYLSLSKFHSLELVVLNLRSNIDRNRLEKITMAQFGCAFSQLFLLPLKHPHFTDGLI